MENTTVSKSSVDRTRKKIRLDTAKDIKNNFSFKPLNLHWDGKIFKEYESTGLEKNELYAVIVTSGNKEQLLAVTEILYLHSAMLSNCKFNLRCCQVVD